MKRRIAVVSSCAPPMQGQPVTGGGLRTLQLVETLKTAGHSVQLLLEEAALPKDAPAQLKKNSFTSSTLVDRLKSLRAAVVVVEQWALVAHLEDWTGPIAVDLHGSLLLENVYRRDTPDLILDSGTKLKALRRADLLLVPATAQLNHFASWATLAGFDPRELPLALLPLALPKPPPRRKLSKRPPLHLVYGGATWPWIDSLLPLTTAAAWVESRSAARLDVFAYSPPRHGLALERSLDTWPELLESLKGRSKKGVRLHRKSPHPKYVDFLRKTATVALDLWQPNPERMLAATTRTVEFLWAGLPVITVEGAAWSEELLASGAGWTVPADDPDALRELLDELAQEPERIRSASEAATQLIATRHSLATAGEQLLSFCAKPQAPMRLESSLVDAMVSIRKEHLDEELASLRRAHAEEHDVLIGTHRKQITDREASERSERERIVEDHGAQIERLTNSHREQIDLLRRQSEENVAAAVEKLEGRLSDADQSSAKTLEDAHKERDRLLASADERWSKELSRIRSEQRAELARLTTEQRKEIEGQT
ncbi:MAG: glycosyltransferase, partial [Myxococcota bacterium]|nr:glycosyltransferase [Myxococcota bacterium]